MIQNYMAVDGQSNYDVCLNTYGNLDQLCKLLIDNNIDGVEDSPITGQIYSFDSDLVTNSNTNQLSIISNRYATLVTGGFALEEENDGPFILQEDGSEILVDPPQ